MIKKNKENEQKTEEIVKLREKLNGLQHEIHEKRTASRQANTKIQGTTILSKTQSGVPVQRHKRSKSQSKMSPLDREIIRKTYFFIF